MLDPRGESPVPDMSIRTALRHTLKHMPIVLGSFLFHGIVNDVFLYATLVFFVYFLSGSPVYA